MICEYFFGGAMSNDHQRIDWPAIIRHIRKRGRMRLIDIAAACDCSEAALSDLVTGRSREPRHALGERLRQLHEQVSRGTGKTQVAEFNGG